MARIRTIKPDFWSDGKVVTLSAHARLMFIGSWNFALCDDGHLADDVMGLKLKILPADAVDPFALIQELLDAGVMTQGETSDGRSYLHVPRLRDHQKVDDRWKPRCYVCSQQPAEASPKLTETRASSDETHRASPELAETRPGKEGKVREGKEQPPTEVAPRKRGHRLPDGFAPTDELRTWALERGFNNAQIDEMTERFSDHWHSTTGTNATKVDWNRAWRNWVGKEDPKRVRGAVRHIRPASGYDGPVKWDESRAPWNL